MKSPYSLKIYIDRLKTSLQQPIDEKLPVAFLEVAEREFFFEGEIHFKGSAYLASDYLVIELHLSAHARLPCKICNQLINVPLTIKDFCHTIELSEIKSAVFDYGEEVREAILLAAPTFIECHDGHCPERATLQQYTTKHLNK